MRLVIYSTMYNMNEWIAYECYYNGTSGNSVRVGNNVVYGGNLLTALDNSSVFGISKLGVEAYPGHMSYEIHNENLLLLDLSFKSTDNIVRGLTEMAKWYGLHFKLYYGSGYTEINYFRS